MRTILAVLLISPKMSWTLWLMQNSLLIRRGTVVTETGSSPKDVRVEGGRISELASSLSPRKAEEVLDAQGLLVLPGGVDPHVHVTRRPSVPSELFGPDDLVSSSWAALAGGVTTVGEIPSPDGDEGVVDTINRVEAEVRSKSLVDVFVHPVLGSTTHKIEQIAMLPRRGQPSLKIFLVNPGIVEDPAGLKRAVQQAADAKVTVLFHCESLSELAFARDTLTRQGKTSLHYLPESRPVIAEVRATEHAISLCRDTGATGYIVHISSAEALELCTAARAEGVMIHTETRPEFLYLTAASHRSEHAKLHVIIPPLREDADRQALWRGITDGSIDVVATDDAAFWSKEQKLAAPDSYEKLLMGISGLELFRPMLFSEGVVKGLFSVERFVEITATTAARIFGLYPQKGTIAAGSDADLVLWDAQETQVITADNLFSRCGFSVYEGRRVTGWPVCTLRRGEVVYQHRRIYGEPGTGNLVSRTVTPLIS